MSVFPASTTHDPGAGERSERSTAPQAPFPWHKDVTGKSSRLSRVSIIPLDVLVRLIPSCGEATATWIPDTPADPRRVVNLATGEISEAASMWSQLPELDRDLLNHGRSIGRSSTEMRRFMVHNRLTKMWVITWEESCECTPETARARGRDVAAFIKRLRRDFFRGRDFPYLYGLEKHPGGHGWHCNVFLQDVFIDKHQMQRCWGKGNVYYTDFTKDAKDCFGREIGSAPRRGASGAGRIARRGARRAAAYGAKYGSKDWGTDSMGKGAHRYERAEGFSPKVIVKRFTTFSEAERWLSAHPSYGRLEFEWLSSSMDEWPGPPCRAYHFDAPNAPPKRVKGQRS